VGVWRLLWEAMLAASVARGQLNHRPGPRQQAPAGGWTGRQAGRLVWTDGLNIRGSGATFLPF
jgi:hypothetical protein